MKLYHIKFERKGNPIQNFVLAENYNEVLDYTKMLTDEKISIELVASENAPNPVQLINLCK